SPSRGPPQGPVRPLAGPAPIGGPRASSALPTDGRRGCVPHGPAPERRNGRSPRSECVRPVRRAGAGGRRDLHARRRGLAPHGPAPERRHGRGLRPECGRPVRRAGAGGRRDLHARRPCGQNAHGQCDVPALEVGVTYTHVACDVPALEGGVTYTHVAAGGRYTVLFRSDGTVAAFGQNEHGQCDVPALEGGVVYTHAAAGPHHTVLLRSDGTVAACGQNADGQCDVPALEGGVTYTARLFGVKLLLQASFDGVSLRFLTLGGVERCRLLVAPGALLADVHHQLLDENAAGRLGPGFDRVDAVLPDRLLLSEASVDETVASVFGPARGG
ncbi:unnamed protein product, partial [Prorocentrum cordatum]